jgi:membrane protease YdiL (CAAX protease family)
LSSGSAPRGNASHATGTVPSRITLRNVLIAAASEIVIALSIIHFTEPAVMATLAQAAVPSLRTAAIGLATGLGMAALQIAGINASQRWRRFLSRAVGSTPRSTAHIVVIGVAVGIAEELLFRAAIQPLVGVTAASLIFAAVHWNYAAPRGSRETLALSALAFVLIFLISVVLGHVFVAFGLGAAIVAHASYDIVVLMKYRQLSAVLRSS